MSQKNKELTLCVHELEEALEKPLGYLASLAGEWEDDGQKSVVLCDKVES